MVHVVLCVEVFHHASTTSNDVSVDDDADIDEHSFTNLAETDFHRYMGQLEHLMVKEQGVSDDCAEC